MSTAIEALESGVLPYFPEHRIEKEAEWERLRADLDRVRGQKVKLTQLKPEHAEAYRRMLSQAEREIASKVEDL